MFIVPPHFHNIIQQQNVLSIERQPRPDAENCSHTHSYLHQGGMVFSQTVCQGTFYRVETVCLLHIFVLSHHCISDASTVTQIQSDPEGAPKKTVTLVKHLLLMNNTCVKMHCVRICFACLYIWMFLSTGQDENNADKSYKNRLYAVMFYSVIAKGRCSLMRIKFES